MPPQAQAGSPQPPGHDGLLADPPFRLLAEAIPQIVWTALPDGLADYHNRRWSEYTGLSAEESRGEGWLAALHPEDAARCRRDWHQAVAAGSSYQQEHRIRDAAGAYRWFLVRGEPVRDADELIVRWFGTCLDIEDQKQADTQRRLAEELQQSEARYRDLFENANDIIYTLDLQGRITSVNKRAERAFGYSRAECVGRSAAELVAPEYLPVMREALRRKLAGEETPTVYEVELICKDGSRVPLEISSRLILRDGLPVGVQGIARDTRERKQAEQALRESEERLRLALDAGHCGVWDWDIVANRLTWSERVYEFHGLAPGEFGGRVEDFAALVHPEDSARVEEAVRRALQQGAAYSEEFRILRPGGAVRWISTNARVLFDEAGRPVRMLGATIDVTERRAAEDALKEADRRKDEFLAMLAHELRNPLAPIRNAAAVLKLTGPADPNVVRAREMIDRQVAQLAHLVDDLLDVSRISRGKVLIRKERLDLVPLVRAAAEDHRLLLEGGGLTLLVQMPDHPLWLDGDPTRLAQVVGNLLHNASKFTDPGGVVVVHLSAQAGSAVLSVRDTGIGLEAGMLARLFEPFSQADRSLARSRGGLGLGLALVKGLVELHGGSVRAASAGPGKGAEFTVRLPLGCQGAPRERAAPSAVRGKRSLRVLLVEDNRDAAESLRMLLDLWGHRVTVAHGGSAGLEAARQLRPDVVLCDIGLPGGLDGYDVARALRADPTQAGALLVALSGYGQEEDKRRAEQAGFDRHLTKPVDPEILAGVLGALP